MAAEESTGIVKLVYAIVLSSIKKGASQIVVRRVGEQCVVELEIAGSMQEEMRPPLNIVGPMIERIARMANLPSVRAGETAYGAIHLTIAGPADKYFAVTVTSSGDRAHASLRAISAGDFAKLRG
jgi:type II secretory ATPase GspE/PulE/Tfp pilus assembly ATPase PilB-like protein